jgi:hypothetical protein
VSLEDPDFMTTVEQRVRDFLDQGDYSSPKWFYPPSVGEIIYEL